MQIHQVKRTTKLKRSRLIGRGGRRGKTSGRGTKGQRARAGHKIRPEIRDLIKKLPKLRGRGMNSNKPIGAAFSVVSLADIDTNFKAGETVSPQNLFRKNLIRKVKGKFGRVKVVGPGEITKKLTFSGVAATESAKKIISAAGGILK